MTEGTGRVRSQADAWSGVFFIVLGAGALGYALLSYRMGTPANMGPGFFPALVGAVIALLGIGILVSTLRPSSRPAEEPAGDGGLGLGGLVAVLAAVLGFALLLRPFGLIVSVVALVVVARLARLSGWLELVVLAAVLTLIAWLIFVVGLAMPLRVVPW